MSTKTLMHGVRWTLLTTILRRLVSFVLFIFIAKWLTQSDLGIYRSYSLILVLLTYFTVWGLDSHYLVSRRQEKLNYLSLLQLGLLFSALLTVLLAFLGPGIGALYHSQELGRLLSLSGGIVFIEALRRIVRTRAQKLLFFKALALAETLNVFIYSALCFVLIFFWRKVWLFILLFYLGNLCEMLYLLLVLPPLPKARLLKQLNPKTLKTSLTLAAKHQGFLANVTLINLFQVFSANAPVLFLGAFVEPALLGVFFFASQLIAIPVNMFTTSLSQVFFPLMAKGAATANLQGIRRYSSLVFKIGIPALFAYALALQYLVPFIWGNKWLEALPLILALVLYYSSSLLHHPISGVPYICRKPSWELYWNIATLVLRIASLALGLQVNFSFAVLLFCMVSAIMHLAFYFMSLKLLGARLGHELLYLLAQLPMLIILAVSGLYLLRFTFVFSLVIFIAYAVYLLLAEKETVLSLIDLLNSTS